MNWTGDEIAPTAFSLQVGQSAADVLSEPTRIDAGTPVVVRTVDGQLRDLAWRAPEETKVELVLLGSADGLAVMRHSAAHVLAQAVQAIHADAHLGNGPAVEDGFFYDFLLPGRTFTPESLVALQQKMQQIVKQGQRFVRRELGSAEAQAELAHEPLKRDLLATRHRGAAVSIYDNVDATGARVWGDLCRGPHVPSTRFIRAFELTRTSSAYWLGDEANPQLQRVYGTAWASKDDLAAHKKRLEERAKRDHRVIGAAMDLFAFSDAVGQGLPLWLPAGTVIRDELQAWAREIEREHEYQQVATPHITREELYHLSGHLPYYDDDLYGALDIEGEPYRLRPMNCPHHHMVYAARPHSYRDLPYRIAEYGTVYRFEQSGQLHGLMRVRGFTQNDAHVYCRIEDAEDEFTRVMRMHDYYYRALGITDFHMVFATRDPSNTKKFHPDTQMWERAQAITRRAMEASEIPFEEDFGGAAHYGPKADFLIRSVTGKPFAASTNQVDLYTPQRFDLTFKDSDGRDKPVAVIHRAPLGSHERFIAFLVEHYNGWFPLWLAPEQIRLVPIMPEHGEYAESVRRDLLRHGFRVTVDHSDGRFQAKVRNALTRRVPLVGVVGAEEVEHHQVALRTRDRQLGSVSISHVIEYLQHQVRSKSLEHAGHQPSSA